MHRTLKLILSTASALALVAVTATPAVAGKPSDPKRAEKSRGQSEVRKPSSSSSHSSARSHSSGRDHSSASATPRSGSSSHGSSVRSAPPVRSAPTVRSAPSTRGGGGPSIDRGRSMSTPRYESHGQSTRATPAPRSFEPRERSTQAKPPSYGRSGERGTFDSRDRGRPTERREVERQQPTRGPRVEQPRREERSAPATRPEFRGNGNERRSDSGVGGRGIGDPSRGNLNRGDQNRGQDVRDSGRPGSRVDERIGNDSRSFDSSRSHDREGARRWQSQERYDRKYAGKATQNFEGSVQRYEQTSGGYNVWIDGGHCFFVPDYRWHLWPLRIGLHISFGGFWNPLGFYNVYDYGYGPYGGGYGGGYSGGYYGGGGYSGGYYGGGYRSSYPNRYYGDNATTYVQGYVDRFDESDGGFVVRDDRSGRYISVYLRYDDPQYNSLRVGDWVTLSGAWTRDGYFEAHRIDDVR